MIDTSIPIELINRSNKDTLADHLGIEIIELNENYLKARMPVDKRTYQQYGLLNGGASAALAETAGSVAATLSLDRTKFICLGLEMKINHIKSVKSGFVYATASPVHLGKSTHIWQIHSKDESGELVSLSTLTLVILPLEKVPQENIDSLQQRLR
jgi:1,4-dihydroxy-2-naphthoyl-CoA hydrolase